MRGNIGCDYFKEHLDAYIDSDLNRETRDTMNRHADACVDCGERLERATRLAMMLAELDEGLSVPLACQAAWRNAIRDEAKLRSARSAKRPVWKRTLSGIAAAMVVWIGATAAFRMQGAFPLNGLISGGTRTNGALTWFNKNAPDTQTYYATNLAASGGAGVYVQTDGAIPTEAPDQAATPTAAATLADAANAPILRKSAARTLETAQFDQGLQLISELTSDYDGYLEQSSVSGQPLSEGFPAGRSARIAARIPAAHLDAYLQSLDTVGTVTSRSEASEDVSANYYDVASRRNAYQAQLTRLNELVAKAATLEDLLLLQDKITEVQAQSDALESELRDWSDKADYAAVTVTMQEIAPDAEADAGETTALADRARSAFDRSLVWLKGFLQDAAVVGAWLAPLLVLIVPVVVVVCLIVHAVRRRKRRDRR